MQPLVSTSLYLSIYLSLSPAVLLLLTCTCSFSLLFRWPNHDLVLTVNSLALVCTLKHRMPFSCEPRSVYGHLADESWIFGSKWSAFSYACFCSIDGTFSLSTILALISICQCIYMFSFLRPSSVSIFKQLEKQLCLEGCNINILRINVPLSNVAGQCCIVQLV